MDYSASMMAIDSAGLWFRAVHAMPSSMRDQHGRSNGAIRGFFDMCSTVLEQYQPAGFVACLDQDWRPQWRVDALADYKLHRLNSAGEEDAPEHLAPQVQAITRILHAASVQCLAVADAEADDIFGQLSSMSFPTLLVSGDKDHFQLVNDSTQLVYVGAGMGKRVCADATVVRQRYGFDDHCEPSLTADYSVLVGDASDGIAGVAGIGAKTAANLVNEYGRVEQIVAAAHDESSSMSARNRTQILQHQDYIAAAASVIRLTNRSWDIGLPDTRRGAVNPTRDEAVTIAGEYGAGKNVERFLDAVSTCRGV